ncbi:PocR ligand-binding domain-containing protein [Fusobacterium sp.]|uniref:PocR ligand-binding domain-containing protein n=1 Tax=Fusobacterium sp. TaxID=68766 RepID=UPI0025BD5C9C|nr:PocR ligand-binding domain-containing protein [Fusobacterium sp.]
MRNKENLSEYLDIEFFQTIQDKLAFEFGIGSIITDINGKPLTKQSNFSDFCSKYIRGNKLGFKRCMECDSYGGNKAKELKKPVIYKCHAGLIDFASPIIIKGEIVGCFLCGQILSESPDEDKFKEIAKSLNIDEEEYITALKKVKVIPYENIEYAANFLYELSSKLSNFLDYQEVGMKTSKRCYNSINKFDNFLWRLKFRNFITNNTIQNFQGLFKRVYDTSFKNFDINDNKLDKIQQDISFLSEEINNISQKIKNTEKNYSNFDINSFKK